MKSGPLLLVVAANLVVLVVLVFVYPHLMISPGPPIDAHADLTTDCFACHTLLLGSRPGKCIACHEVAQIGLKTTKGLIIAGEQKNVAFHQQLVEADCIACHSDHKGVKAFRPISQFSHELLQPGLRIDCAGCHAGPNDALHRNISGNCGQCHTRAAWLPATFDHDQYFRFDRDHRTECKTCHLENDYSAYTCYGCHEHSRSKVREEHVEEGILDYEQCADCHRSGDEDEAKRTWRARELGAGRAPDDRRNQDRRDRHDD